MPAGPPVGRDGREGLCGGIGFHGTGKARQKCKHPRAMLGGVFDKFRRRPTLPGGLPPSTIGAVRLNCRVRNGNGCNTDALTTGNPLSNSGAAGKASAASRTPEQVRAVQ